MSKSDKPPLRSKSPIGGPFKATNIWRDLVTHLYEHANVKRRRVMMKYHNDCFSGGNAVDTLLRYVRTNPNRFPNTTMVNRENICRLCQSFLDADVFECINAGEDSERKTKFEDSASRLYRFNSENQFQFMDDAKENQSSNLQTQISVAASSDAEGLPSKFRSLSTGPQTVEPATRHRQRFSPFNTRGRKKSFSLDRKASSYNTSDSDCENIRPKSMTRKSPNLKRRASFVGMVMKRSSSDSNMIKDTSTGSSSESESKRQSPSEHLTRGMMRLSQRLSFRKKSLSRSCQSTFHLQQACIIQNLKTEEEPESLQGSVFMRSDVRRRSAKSMLPSHNCDKIQVLSSKPILRKLSKREESHVKRESIRVRLLQILDLPFIETLVISPVFDKKMLVSLDQQRMNRYSGMNYGEVASAYDNDDSWMFNALTVLQHIPDSYNILKKYAALPQHRKKSELYFTIANHYKSLQRPLIDDNYNPIVGAIISLLESRPAEKIMEPMQLFIHLLSEVRSTELRHLFMFLSVVCNQKEVKLAHKGSNRAVIIDTFTPCILRLDQSPSSISGLDGAKGLVRFMIHHHLRVFMLPASIEMIIRRKIDLLEHGNIDSPSVLPDSTYCPLISEAEYNEQKTGFTQKQVQDLYTDIKQSAIPPKKKKDLLKKMQRQHPLIFDSSKNQSAGSSTAKAGKVIEKKSHQRRSRIPLTRSRTSVLETKSSVHRRSSTVTDAIPVTSLSKGAVPPSTAPLARKSRTSTTCSEVFV